jgi:hypothetical protein
MEQVEACKHPVDILEATGQRWHYLCGICGQVLTSRQVGLNPRACEAARDARDPPRNKWAVRNWRRKQNAGRRGVGK